jgi:hypothetical protein
VLNLFKINMFFFKYKMSEESKHLLFYSNYCSFSNEVHDKIKKHNLKDKFLLINISKHKFKIPSNIKSVPTLLLNDKKTLYVDKELHDYIDKLAEDSNKDVDPFSPFGGISNKFSFVDKFETENDGLTKNFGLIIGEQNITTPTEESGKSRETLVDKMSSIEQNRNSDIQEIYKTQTK